MISDFFILMKAEVSLVLIIFILLFIKVAYGGKNNTTLMHVTNILLLINFIFGFFLNTQGNLFNEMYYTNESIVLEKNILNFGTLIISLLSFNWLKNNEHLLEYYILLLSTVLGLFYMISSGNFLIFYLGLELSSIPLAALVNFDLGSRKSSEAAMKMILSTAFASGIMLFGISLLYGTTGSIIFSELQELITGTKLQLLSLLFVFSGFAFKLSLAPFHFWTADVYEGAPVSITAFLSVISKAAIVFVFISVLHPLFRATHLWYPLLLLSIVLTILIGNIFAIRQTNIKRFLAFSSIAQVGYILLGLSAENEIGVSSTIYFLIVYLFSNLGAFAVVSLISAQTNKENIGDYNGLYKTNPLLSWIISLSLFSLAGIPPTAGFFGKMFLVAAGAAKGNYLLIGFAALNMVISLYYYLRIVKAIFINTNENPVSKLNCNFYMWIVLLVCVGGILITGFASGVYQYISCVFNF